MFKLIQANCVRGFIVINILTVGFLVMDGRAVSIILALLMMTYWVPVIIGVVQGVSLFFERYGITGQMDDTVAMSLAREVVGPKKAYKYVTTIFQSVAMGAVGVSMVYIGDRGFFIGGLVLLGSLLLRAFAAIKVTGSEITS